MARTDRIGQLIGDYRMARLLGGGGFGEVYQAEHIHTHQQAAVKVLHFRLTQKEEWREFLNEARTMRLKHPHIIQLLDFGITDEDIPFLAMEYAPNGTLRQRHPRGTQVALTTVVAYVQALASALQYAHDQRLVHRDVKPENILLGAHGNLLLSDFGIVISVQSSQSINDSGVGGTLPYMAPEQLNGKPRPASDQYALAIMTYEWLTGVRPFSGTHVELITQHTATPPPPMSRFLPHISIEVEDVVLTALEKDPKARFATIQAFATALAQAAQSSRSTDELPIPSPVDATLPQHDLHAEPYFAATPLVDIAHEEPLFTENISTHISSQAATPYTHGTESVTLDLSDSEHFATAGMANTLPIIEPVVPVINAATTTLAIPAYQHTSRKKVLFLSLLLILVLGSSSVLLTLNLHANQHKPDTAAQQATALNKQSLTATTNALHTNTAITPTTDYTRYTDTQGMMFGFNAQHTQTNPFEHTLNATNVSHLVTIWTSSIKNSCILCQSLPSVAGNTLYLSSWDTDLYAMNATNGTVLWSFPTGSYLTTSPAIVDGTVYVGSDDNTLYAVDATTGNKKWSFTTGRDISSSPTVVDGTVYFGANDRHFYALDAATGNKKWAFQIDSDIRSSPAVANGIVYFGSYDNKLHALDATTGVERWSFSAGSYIASSPAVANGIVYFGSNDRYFYALDARTGKQKWSFLSGNSISSSPAINNGIVYFGSDDGNLYALHANSGNILWISSHSRMIESSPTIANGLIYFVCDDGNIYALDASNGLKKWSFQGNINYSPVVANGMVFAGSGNGALYAFGLPAGTH